MFNNSSNQNNLTTGAVDDIFAETEQPAVASAPAAKIETSRVGLATEDGNSGLANPAEAGRSGKLFKIVLTVIVIAILGLGGYVVYSKFFQKTGEVLLTDNLNNNSVPTTNNSGYVSGTILTTTTPSAPVVTPVEVNPIEDDIPATTSIDVPPLDTDSDGLTDTEEQLAGTDINLVDTDKDSLSDYEEVRIYLTNPLNTDSDGDSYLDGAEVNNGYNPNGAGKLPGV